MKQTTKVLAFTLLALSMSFSACDNDQSSAQLPGTATQAAFADQFPEARNVRWNKQEGYDVASFSLPANTAAARSNTAWYSEGETQLAYSDIELSEQQLGAEAPAVLAAWNASAYKTEGYRLDDIDRLTRAGEAPVYKLEIESGERERELFYAADGTLLTDKPDLDDNDDNNDENTPGPQQITDFITQKYPTAVIIDFEKESENGTLYYVVEIRIGTAEKELLFNKDYSFLYSATEVENPETELPAVVYQAFLTLAPDMDTWDDVAILEDGEGVLTYALTAEDEQTDRETLYIVDAEGDQIQ